MLSETRLQLYQERILLIGLVAVLLFVPSTWLTNWDHIKMITVHGAIIVYFALSVWRKSRVSLDLLDWIIISYVGWNFLSYTWTDYRGMIWYESFHWLSLLGVYFAVRKHGSWISTKQIAWVFLIVMIGNYVIFGKFHIELLVDKEFRFTAIDSNFLAPYLGYAKNYISATMVVLFPLCIGIYNYLKLPRPIIFSLAIVHILFILLSNSRASILALLMVMIALYLLFQKSIDHKERRLLFVMSIITIILAFSILNSPTDFIKKLNPLTAIGNKHGDERLKLWSKTIKLIREAPLRGHGANCWKIHHLKYGYGDIRLFADSAGQHKHAHNSFLEAGSELGIIGLMLLVLMFFYPLYMFWKSKKNTEPQLYQIYLLLSIMSFFIVSNFYGLTYTDHYAFGSIDLIFIIILGLIRHTKNKSTKINIPTFAFLVMAIIPFIFRLYVHNKRNDIKEFRTLTSHTNLRALQKIRSIYHPIFYQYNDYQPVKAQEALILWRDHQCVKAIEIMNQAVSHHPYQARNWLRLGNMNRDMGNLKMAQDAYFHCMDINEYYFRPRIKLAEISLELRDWDMFNQALTFYPDWLQGVVVSAPKNINIENIGHAAYLKKLCDYEREIVRLYNIKDKLTNINPQ